MRHIIHLSAMFLLLAVPARADTDDGERTRNGKALFEKHGCSNCHGENGVHPKARYVPVLKGKPADYIFENAMAIFGGEVMSTRTRFMHDQFCVGKAKEEGCYLPPGKAELRVIANWLGPNGDLPKKKRTKRNLYVTSVHAHERLKQLGDKSVFIDVRTRSEVAFLGMPTMADANIPYMTTGAFQEWDEKKGTFKLEANGYFVERVQELVTVKGLGKDSPIYLICRSGSRSAKAANLLELAGFSQVYTVTDGFEGDKAKEGPRKGERVVNGWKNSGLPWSYKLKKGAMFWQL